MVKWLHVIDNAKQMASVVWITSVVADQRWQWPWKRVQVAEQSVRTEGVENEKMFELRMLVVGNRVTTEDGVGGRARIAEWNHKIAN